MLKTMQVQNTLHTSVRRVCIKRGEEKMKRAIERRNTTLRLGVGSQRGKGYQTRQSLLLSDPLSEYVFVYVCARKTVPPPQPDNREGPVPDWGQLVAAEGRGGGGRGGERGGGWVEGIRHHCLTCVSGLGRRGTKNQTALRITNEERGVVREECRTRR